MILNGIAISGYRSFNGHIQFLSPLAKINLIIGKNNSGKSNILRFINNHLSAYINFSIMWASYVRLYKSIYL